MRYTAHLSTGGTVELSVEDMLTADSSGWIMDDNGATINMKFCAAIVPVIEPALSDLPDRVVDGDGDVWMREGDGYRLLGGDAELDKRLTLSEIRSRFGFADDQS